MSYTDIANNAIALVGGERIGTIDDNTKGARLCKALLPGVVNSCLERALWGFATKTISLAQLVDAPSDAEAAYQLPNDCVRVGYVDGQPFRVKDVTKWRLRGRTLLLMGGAALEEVTVHYVSKTTSPDWFTPMFTEAVEYMLASKLALSIPESKTLATTLFQQAELTLARAAGLDAVQGSSDYRKPGKLHSARLAGSSGVRA